MKTKLLFSLLFAFSLTAFSQTLQSEDFNGLTLGNISEDLTGATAGQGGFYVFGTNGADPTTTTNSASSNFQVIASGYNGSQGAQIVSPNGDAGVRYLFKPVATEWSGRTLGNNIAELEFMFYTGSSSSAAPFRAVIAGTNAGAAASAVAIQFDPATMELSGLATLAVGGVPDLYGFSLGADDSDLILPANTWLSVGCSYNTLTGEIRWKTSFNDTNAFFNNAANVLPGMTIDEVDFLSFGTTGNTIAANYTIDDYKFKASATDQLLGLNDVVALELASVSLFPNPAKGSITLASDISIKSVEVFNNLGQVVLQKNSDFSNTNTFDISNLTSGVYIMTINSTDGASQTKRFIKE
ncbi:T9SS type A sorting domain-containing protein [Winogradskyella sp. PC D3.3]